MPYSDKNKLLPGPEHGDQKVLTYRHTLLFLYYYYVLPLHRKSKG